MYQCISIKIPFTPKGGRLCEKNFLRYLDLLQIKGLSSIIGFEPIRSVKKLFSQNLQILGKGYFAAIGTVEPLCSCS